MTLLFPMYNARIADALGTFHNFVLGISAHPPPRNIASPLVVFTSHSVHQRRAEGARLRLCFLSLCSPFGSIVLSTTLRYIIYAITGRGRYWVEGGTILVVVKKTTTTAYIGRC